MAYDLHIEKTGKSLENWKEFVINFPALTLSEKAEVRNPTTGQIISISTPNAAKAENGLYFTPRVSNNELSITIRNPKDSDIPFLKKITDEFGGILIGDEGEQY